MKNNIVLFKTIHFEKQFEANEMQKSALKEERERKEKKL
jgi:hypothetical protein